MNYILLAHINILNALNEFDWTLRLLNLTTRGIHNKLPIKKKEIGNFKMECTSLKREQMFTKMPGP